jgi:hypothetical protein
MSGAAFASGCCSTALESCSERERSIHIFLDAHADVVARADMTATTGSGEYPVLVLPDSLAVLRQRREILINYLETSRTLDMRTEERAACEDELVAIETQLEELSAPLWQMATPPPPLSVSDASDYTEVIIYAKKQ